MNTPSMVDILILPVLLTVFAFFALIPALNTEGATGKTSKGWYVGLVLVGLALLLGLKSLWSVTDPFYRAQFAGYGMRRAYYSHFLAPLIPAAALAGALALRRTRRNRLHSGF